MITSKEIAVMTLSEKMQVMEMLWEDLSRSGSEKEEYLSPQWHFNLLRSREIEAQDRTNFEPLESAKKSILDSLNER